MDNKFIYYILAFLNSSVAEKFFKVLSPTLDLHEGPLGRIPLIINEDYLNTLDNLSKDAIIKMRNNCVNQINSCLDE